MLCCFCAWMVVVCGAAHVMIGAAIMWVVCFRDRGH